MWCIQMKSSAGWLSVKATPHSPMIYKHQEKAESVARLIYPQLLECGRVRVVSVATAAAQEDES